MEDLIFKWVRELSPFGFTCLIVYLHYIGALPKIMRKILRLNGELPLAEKLATNHIPHLETDISKIKEDVAGIKVSMEKLAPYDWCEREFKEMKGEIKTDLKDAIDDLEKHLGQRIDDIKK